MTNTVTTIPETLDAESRRPFSARALWVGVTEIAASRTAVGYILATGLINGALEEL